MCQCLRPFGGLRGTPGGMRALFGRTGIDGTLIPGTLRYRIWRVIESEGHGLWLTPYSCVGTEDSLGKSVKGPWWQ